MNYACRPSKNAAPNDILRKDVNMEPTGPKKPRDVAEIFSELGELCRSDGALHEISALIYRDWVVTVDLKRGEVTDDPDYRWSTSKLNKNELLLLLGLAVQSTDGRTYTVQSPSTTFGAEVDRLCRELHDAINWAARPTFDPETGVPSFSPEIGPLAREAIYYGAESFYLHQFDKFARIRYARDEDWLKVNAGGSIDELADICQHIVGEMTKRMSAVGQMRGEGRKFSAHELTDSLILTKEELVQKFGDHANAFLARFSTPAMNANSEFVSPFSVNAVTIAPVIDLGEYVYIPNQYRLIESLYESPFYWMQGDETYRATASDNRGHFVEETSANILRTVFGNEHVFENVKLYRGKNVVGEVDVLVVYGEYLLIGQAKSKRVTLKARAGDSEALKVDFEGAIQHPFRQAQECAALLRASARGVDSNGNEVAFPDLPRIFLLVLLSDGFPAAKFLSHSMLSREGKDAPVIWDLGVLDCATRIFRTPVKLLYYLKCRADAFDNMVSDSEYNFIGFHLKNKLVLPEEADMVMIDREFATVVDDFMIAADLKVEREPPEGILERVKFPFVTPLMDELQQNHPIAAALALDLYDFSSAALETVSELIKKTREEVRNGKAIKAFTLLTGSGGFTYAIVARQDERSRFAAHSIGQKHKYDRRADRWYVILDDVGTDNPIDAMLPLLYPWEASAVEDEHSKNVQSVFRSTATELKSGNKPEDEET